jgi:hypothetical protein
MEFLQLLEAVKTGQVTPQQAGQLLMNRMGQELQQQAATSIEGVDMKNQNKERLLNEKEAMLSVKEKHMKDVDRMRKEKMQAEQKSKEGK